MSGPNNRLKMSNAYGLTEWEYEEINRMAEEASMKRMDPLFDNHPTVVEQRKQSAEFIEKFKGDQNQTQTFDYAHALWLIREGAGDPVKLAREALERWPEADVPARRSTSVPNGQSGGAA